MLKKNFPHFYSIIFHGPICFPQKRKKLGSEGGIQTVWRWSILFQFHFLDDSHRSTDRAPWKWIIKILATFIHVVVPQPWNYWTKLPQNSLFHDCRWHTLKAEIRFYQVDNYHHETISCDGKYSWGNLADIELENGTWSRRKEIWLKTSTSPRRPRAGQCPGPPWCPVRSSAATGGPWSPEQKLPWKRYKVATFKKKNRS